MTKFVLGRLRKELDRFAKATARGEHQGELQLISPDYNSATTRDDELWHWQVLMAGPQKSIYQGETYLLHIDFTSNYPLDPPRVRFAVTGGWQAPVHEHVYANGIICLSLLTKSSRNGNWSPALTTANLLLALQSMLASATVKRRPRGHENFVRRTGKRGERFRESATRWDFHDEKC